MNKNAYAFGFALIGLGVGLWINSDSAEVSWATLAICACIGVFVGYFVAGLAGAKSSLLQKSFQSLGSLSGKSLDEIVAVVGEPTERRNATISDRDNAPGYLVTWAQNQYAITLLFDADCICIGVTSETCAR